MDNNPQVQQSVPPQPIPQQEIPQATSGFPKMAMVIIGLVILILLVGVGAYYLGTNKNKSVPQTVYTQPTSSPSHSVSPTPSPTPIDETANWKTYSSNGYLIKYPPTWSINHGVYTNNNVDIYNPTNMVYQSRGNGSPPKEYYPTQFVGIFSINSSQTPKEYVNTIISEWKNDKIQIDYINAKDYILNGLPSEIYTEPGEGGRGRLVVVSNGKQLVELNISSESPELDKDINQILSTFKFTQ